MDEPSVRRPPAPPYPGIPSAQLRADRHATQSKEKEKDCSSRLTSPARSTWEGPSPTRSNGSPINPAPPPRGHVTPKKTELVKEPPTPSHWPVQPLPHVNEGAAIPRRRTNISAYRLTTLFGSSTNPQALKLLEIGAGSISSDPECLVDQKAEEESRAEHGSDRALVVGGGGSPRDRQQGRRYRTSTTQTNLQGELFDLYHFLIHQESGEATVVSAAHAKDRELLRRLIFYNEATLRAEEIWQRSRIFISHRDGLDALWKLFKATVPRVDRFSVYRTSGGGTSSIAAGLESTMGDLMMLNATDGGVGADDPTLSPSASSLNLHHIPVDQETEILRRRVERLEKALSKRLAGHGIVIAASTKKRRTASLFAAGQGRSTVSLQHSLGALEAAETRTRELILELQLEAHEHLRTQIRLNEEAQQTRTTKRVLIHTPFTSYRPKVPLEHSFAPEEYLRRWVLAETFNHYNDVMTMLQTHENDNRHAIEVEEDAVWRPLFRAFVEPYYERRCGQLTADMAAAMIELQVAKATIADAGAKVQLAIMEESEAYGRDLIEGLADEQADTAAQVMAQLESVRSLEIRIARLTHELTQQRRRHRAEVQSLHAQLPHDGIVKLVPYASHCAIELPSQKEAASTMFHKEMMTPIADQAAIVDGASFSFRSNPSFSPAHSGALQLRHSSPPPSPSGRFSPKLGDGGRRQDSPPLSPTGKGRRKVRTNDISRSPPNYDPIGLVTATQGDLWAGCGVPGNWPEYTPLPDGPYSSVRLTK